MYKKVECQRFDTPLFYLNGFKQNPTLFSKYDMHFLLLLQNQIA